MRYKADQKEETRRKMLEAAGRGFRSHGYSGIGVDGLAKAADVTSGAFYSHFGSSTYIFTIKTNVASDLFICLDTGGGTLGNKQLDWLEDKLQSLRPDYRRCIVFTHNNFFRFQHTSSTNPLVEELQILMDLFTKYQVNMVVTGHDHEHDVELFGNTTYLVMDALKDGLSNSGYLQLIIENGNIEYKFINL